MPLNLKEVMKIATEIAEKAGSLALEMQHQLGAIEFKSPKDTVTQADIAADKLILSALQEAFPTHQIRTEETGFVKNNSAEDYTWIIDPIDGTINYSRGMPNWGISLALFDAQGPLLAVCFLPKFDEMFTAIRGQGAYMNGKKISVSNISDMSQAIISNGDFNVGPENRIAEINARNVRLFAAQGSACQRVKSIGSAVLEGCYVAAGRLEVYSMTNSYPWDTAGISLLVQEAGGKASNLNGEAMAYCDEEAVVVSNGILHDEYIQLISPHL